MVAIIPVVQTDELVMVSDGGQIIRMPVEGISFTGRKARGVTLFRVSDGGRVVSVSRIRDVEQVEEYSDEPTKRPDDGSVESMSTREEVVNEK